MQTAEQNILNYLISDSLMIYYLFLNRVEQSNLTTKKAVKIQFNHCTNSKECVLQLLILHRQTHTNPSEKE